MKRIYWLQNLLNFTIWGSVLLFGVMVLAFIVAIVTNDFSLIKIDDLDKNISELSTFETLICLFVFVGYCLFFYALFKMKTLVSHFTKRNFFSPKTTHLSKQTGFLFILSAVITFVPTYFYQIFFNGTFKIGAMEPSSVFFLFIMGIFFQVIGYIFEDAQNFKEDSDLTI